MALKDSDHNIRSMWWFKLHLVLFLALAWCLMGINTASMAETTVKDMFCGNYLTPNPFSPNSDGIEDTQGFVFCLNKSAYVNVSIVNYTGTVRQFLAKPYKKGGSVYNSYLAPGLHTIGWTGTNANGNVLPDGNYRYYITARNGQNVQIVSGIASIRNKAIIVIGGPQCERIDDTLYCVGGAFYSNAVVENEVLRLLNDERNKIGVPGLRMDDELREVARSHSLDMRTNRFFAHVSPTTGSPGDRLNEAGIEYGSYGENVSVGYDSALDIHKGFMNSPGHRVNMLNSSWRKAGIGVIEGGTDPVIGAWYHTTELFTN